MEVNMTSLEHFCHSLLRTDQDFGTAFMMLNGIRDSLREEYQAPAEIVLSVCERILACPSFTKQSQAYFLYRSVAEILHDVMTRFPSEVKGRRCRALDLLLTGLTSPHESLRRASAEGLGMLPLAVDYGPPSEPDASTALPGALQVLDDDWLAHRGIQTVNGWIWQGRSLLTRTQSGDTLVVKCLRRGEDPLALQREAAWMRYLDRLTPSLERRCDVPIPLEHDEGWLVRAPRFAWQASTRTHLHPKRYAVAFLTSSDYFHYPNEADPDRRLSEEAICEVLGRNAWLMGRLMAKGIAHTAPIPLFHNRAQRHRREDGGRYRWTHRGRLDRWLATCHHPNFGVSGLRDFEHFTTVAGRPLLRYETIGSHLISLLLVAGSYFRQKSPERVGLDANRRPVDARDLFDRDLLQAIVRRIWEAYAEGFFGQAPGESSAVIPAWMVDRMIDEMGVDRHMEEILRVVDQQAMSRTMFLSFLQSRGMSLKEAQRKVKGAADITLMTGPHLGGFNQPISLPELIEFAAAGAAHCVAGQFRREQALCDG
jgi:hypothetical protein